MSQLERDKNAIRLILKRMGRASYPEIALYGGEGLREALFKMEKTGEVLRINQKYYELKEGDNNAVNIK